MSTEPKTYQEFSKAIKAKYPEYKDVDDLELAKKMIEKYPDYKDQVVFDTVDVKKKEEPLQNAVPGSTVSSNGSEPSPTPLEVTQAKALAGGSSRIAPSLTNDLIQSGAVEKYLQAKGYSPEEIAAVTKQAQKSSPTLPKIDTTLPQVAVAESTARPEIERKVVNKGYTDEQKKIQDAAFNEAYNIAVKSAVEVRPDGLLLSQDDNDEYKMVYDKVSTVAEQIGKKYKLSSPEISNLRNRIYKTYQESPDVEKAQIGAEMAYKEKYGVTPYQQSQIQKKQIQDKAYDIDNTVYATINNATTELKSQVASLQNEYNTQIKDLSMQYRTAVDSGAIQPEQANNELRLRAEQITTQKQKQLQAAQLRYVKQYNDAVEYAKKAFADIGTNAEMTDEQRQFYNEQYQRHAGGLSQLRAKGQEYLFRNKSVAKKLDAAFTAGTNDMLSAVGGVLGQAGFDDANYEITKAIDKLNLEGKPVPAITAESATDPDWWIANGARTLPMMAVLFAADAGTGAAIGMTARMLGASGRFERAISTVGGGLAGWKLETLTEQGLAYNQALADGKTDREAAQIAADVGKIDQATIPLQMMELFPFFNKMPLSAGLLMSFGSGAAEEVIQGYAQKKANADLEGRPYTLADYTREEEFGPTVALGGLMSLPFAIGGHMSKPPEEGGKAVTPKYPTNPPSPEMVNRVKIASIQNMIYDGSYAKASGIIEVAYNNGFIDEKTRKELDALVEYNRKAIDQTITTVQDPQVRQAAVASLVEMQQAQAASEQSTGVVAEAQRAIAEDKKKEVQKILSGTTPIYTMQVGEKSAPVVMTPTMVQQAINDPNVIEAVKKGEVKLNIINDVKTEEKLQEALVSSEQKQAGEPSTESQSGAAQNEAQSVTPTITAEQSPVIQLSTPTADETKTISEPGGVADIPGTPPNAASKVFEDLDAINQNRSIAERVKAKKTFNETYGDLAEKARDINTNFKEYVNQLKELGIIENIDCP